MRQSTAAALRMADRPGSLYWGYMEGLMPAQTILIWLAIIWVGAAVLGAMLHVIKLLLIVALLASAAVLVMGMASRIGRRP